jgi:hypothetical protein
VPSRVDVLDPALTSGLVDGDGDHPATDRAGVAERENGGSIGLFRCVVPEHDLARMEGFPLVGLAGRVDDDDRAVRPRHDLHGGGAHEQSSEALESREPSTSMSAPADADSRVWTGGSGYRSARTTRSGWRCRTAEADPSSTCSSCSASTTSPSTSGRANTIVSCTR